MWDFISVILLLAEVILLACFVIGRFRNKKLNETLLFLGIVFVFNLALYLIPFLYSVLVQGEKVNYIFGILGCYMSAVKLFFGAVNTGAVADFTMEVPSFTYTYLLGALLALLATVSTAVEAFSHTIVNRFRLAKALKQPVCDIVLGNGESALQYARNSGAILLLGDNTGKDDAVSLMHDGFVVLRRGFSEEFLRSRYLSRKTRYNFICTNEDENYFSCIDTFISFHKADGQGRQFYLYVEVEESKTETIRREIIEKSDCGAFITTFCGYELLARCIVGEYPLTRSLPGCFVEKDTAIRPDAKINVFFLGFSRLSRELYRQSILNNQFVKFEDGEYKVYPVCYRIFDKNVNPNDWAINGLKNDLQELSAVGDRYFSLPELPYLTETIPEEPCTRSVLSAVLNAIRDKESFTYVFVDTGDGYQSIETGARLRSMLDGMQGYRIFVRSDSIYAEGDEKTVYYGDFNRIYNHDIIVDDSLSVMARQLNEMYTASRMQKLREKPDFDQMVKDAAEQSWCSMNNFTRYSNLYSAMNLRVKLNLLGLDYVKDGKGENTNLIADRYGLGSKAYAYEAYFKRSVRNALLAQEHARWNAYHLLSEYLPLEKEGILPDGVQGQKVSFRTKNVAARRHACLTTFCGLNELSCYLAKLAEECTGHPQAASAYDFYIYDEMLITGAAELLLQLGFSVTEKVDA